MADAPVVHIGENSPEEVAYKLLKNIADVEQKRLHHSNRLDAGEGVADRDYILKTYVECLNAVRGYYDPK